MISYVAWSFLVGGLIELIITPWVKNDADKITEKEGTHEYVDGELVCVEPLFRPFLEADGITKSLVVEHKQTCFEWLTGKISSKSEAKSPKNGSKSSADVFSLSGSRFMSENHGTNESNNFISDEELKIDTSNDYSIDKSINNTVEKIITPPFSSIASQQKFVPQSTDDCTATPEVESPPVNPVNETSLVVEEAIIPEQIEAEDLEAPDEELARAEELCHELAEKRREKRAYYENVVEDLKIGELFDDYIQNEITKPFEEGVVIAEDSYSSKFSYKVQIKECKHNKVNHHEIFQNWEMSHTPQQYNLFFNFEDCKDKQRGDTNLDSWDVLYHYMKDDVLYTFIRSTTKKIMFMKGREMVFVSAFKKLENGNYIEMYISYDDREFPVSKKLDRMTVVKGWLLYQKQENDTWKVNNYTFMDPKTKMPIKLVKKVIGGFFSNYFKNNFVIMDEYLKRFNGDMWQIIGNRDYM